MIATYYVLKFFIAAQNNEKVRKKRKLIDMHKDLFPCMYVENPLYNN